MGGAAAEACAGADVFGAGIGLRCFELHLLSILVRLIAVVGDTILVHPFVHGRREATVQATDIKVNRIARIGDQHSPMRRRATKAESRFVKYAWFPLAPTLAPPAPARGLRE